jgi:hypothetical protein
MTWFLGFQLSKVWKKKKKKKSKKKSNLYIWLIKILVYSQIWLQNSKGWSPHFPHLPPLFKKIPNEFHYLYILELLVLWPMMGHFFYFIFWNLIDSGQLVHLLFPHDCISIVRSIGTRVISGGHKIPTKGQMH